jgi:LDH2 family malate/lactate/ureidoglycolate dehydrogenase
MIVTAEALRGQIAAILSSWGIPTEHVAATAHVLVESDLRGVDSHGVSMLTLYDDFRRTSRLTISPRVHVVRESPVTALLDGDGGLGHFPGLRAMDLAIDKCAKTGVGIVAVRNSNHYGAAGVYALRAVERGFIGVSMTATWRPAIVPTFGAQPMLGTNPIAFAAPTRRNIPFCLDMATSTVALNKVKLAALLGKEILPGWALDDQGRVVTNAATAMKHISLTPLGGTSEMSSHKGYGLAAMVEVLSTTLSGAFFSPTRAAEHPDADRYNVGHFFMALDPRAFRGEGEFENDLDAFIDALHATRRESPDQPVLVAGEPEAQSRERRLRDGIPLSDELVAKLKSIASSTGAAWLIGS